MEKAKTPINVPVLVNWLKRYPVATDRDKLIFGFTQGFKLEYKGPRIPRDNDCLLSAKKNVKATLDKLQKEINLGRIMGPFDTRPISTLQCSPIGLIPKQQPGEWRLITHLSFPKGESINDGIPESLSKVKYSSFDHAIDLVQNVNDQAFMAKTDIKSAFRLLPIYPGDFELLGFKFLGKYYIDKCLPMGAAISCSHFECFSTYLEYEAKMWSKSDLITHYLDDFLLISDSFTGCNSMMSKFKEMCCHLGVPLAQEKNRGTSN